ncbi:MAG: HEAT repeat domain-containing protein [Nitrospirales bacterium]|nr:HEAT repeat domain-containing protein [Nitrospirales bacterium]MDR4485472.1 HEAT repeat domain-containing protein [Nitrospirales bacterium]
MLLFPTNIAIVIGAICFIGPFGCVLESPPEPPEAVTERLIPLLTDAQPNTRRTAALSLGKIGAPQSIPALVLALSDPDDQVRQSSAWALGMMADSLSEQSLVALVQHLTDPSDSVKQAVVLALGRTAVQEELLQVLTEAYAISTIDTQRTIIQSLAHFELPFSYSVYLQALESPDSLTRQSAIAGLGELGDPRGLPFLRTHLLQDPSIGVRSEAAFRLGKLGTSADVLALKQAMETDPTPNVHFWASWALVQIGQNT